MIWGLDRIQPLTLFEWSCLLGAACGWIAYAISNSRVRQWLWPRDDGLSGFFEFIACACVFVIAALVTLAVFGFKPNRRRGLVWCVCFVPVPVAYLI